MSDCVFTQPIFSDKIVHAYFCYPFSRYRPKFNLSDLYFSFKRGILKFFDGHQQSSTWLSMNLFLKITGIALSLLALALTGNLALAPVPLIVGFKLISLATAMMLALSARDQLKKTKAAKPVIYQAPGRKLSHFADFFFSKKTVERVYEPILADLQSEYFEALSAGRTRKALWIRFRGYWSFWHAVGLQSLVTVAHKMYSFWKAAG